jgi:hypothetical protein
VRRLSGYLEEWVVPSDGDGLFELLLKADLGARIIGALALVAATHRERGDRLAIARRIKWVDTATTGTWMYLTRACLLADGLSRRPELPSARWRPLLARMSGAPERPIDAWLTPFEVSLRHSHRLPDKPQAAMCARMRAELRGLCEAILATGDDPEITGEGADSRAWDLPCVPFLAVEGSGLLLWENRRNTARWRRVPGGHIVEDVLDPFGGARSVYGSLCSDPLVAATGEDEMPPPRLRVIPVEGDPSEIAEDLASTWRVRHRPVVVVHATLGDDLGSRLDDVLGCESGAKEPEGTASVRALGAWQGLRPTVVFAGRLEPAHLLQIAQMASPKADLVAVVPARLTEQWSPLHTRQAVLDPVYDGAALPPAVAEHAGRPEGDQWLLGAMAAFDLKDAGDLAFVERLLAGTVDVLAGDEDGVRARAWWERGDLRIDGAGRPSLRHPGWRALAAGLLGHGCPDEGSQTVHQAGVTLRAQLLSVQR